MPRQSNFVAISLILKYQSSVREIIYACVCSPNLLRILSARLVAMPWRLSRLALGVSRRLRRLRAHSMAEAAFLRAVRLRIAGFQLEVLMRYCIRTLAFILRNGYESACEP